jgi:ferric iron reductase protein FhuF
MAGRAPRPNDRLAATLARISRIGEHFELGLEARGDGWVEASEVVRGGPELDRAISRLAAWSGDPGKTRAIGSTFVLLYLRFVWPAVAAFALERRVPDVAADNLLVRFNDHGWPSALALKEPRTGAGLHETVIDRHAGPLVETIHTAFRTSLKVLWGNVAAAYALPLYWHVQLAAPDPGRVVRDANELLRHERLHDKIRLSTVAHGGAEWTVHERRTCCLYWQLPAGSKCDDCPLVLAGARKRASP